MGGPGRTSPDRPETGATGPGPAEWQTWWRFNGDAYLGLRSLCARVDARSSREGEMAALVRGRVIPVLRAVVSEGGDEGLMRAALIAMARLGEFSEEPAEVPLDQYAHHYLKTEFQGAQEAAVVALGLSGGDTALDDLVALLLSGEAGRALCGDRPVHPRTRAFAAFSLALLGSSGELDPAQCERVAGSFTEALSDETATWELHTAALLGMGLVPVSDCPDDGTLHVCRGEQLDYLIGYFEDETKPVALRAHAVPPMARLAVGGAPQYKQIVSEILLEAYERNSKMDEQLRQSCIIALGILGDADGDEVDCAIRASLKKAVAKGDELSRRLALVSLARVGAREGSGDSEDGRAECTKVLLARLSRGKDGAASWAALALGVHAHELYAGHRDVDAEVVRALESALLRSRSEDQLAATCIGLAIVRKPEAREGVLARLLSDGDESMRSYAAIALGLSGDESARAPLRELLADEEADARLAWGAGLALRLLHDREATALLLERLETAEGDDRQIFAGALGLAGDPRAIEPLCAVLADTDEEPELRAAIATALGTLCSEDDAAWTARLSTDLNYTALTWTLASPFADGTGILDWN